MLYVIFGIAAGVIALFFAVIYICYRLAFAVPKKYRKSPPALLKGEQYDSVLDKIVPLIENVKRLPFEDVYTLSGDGLRLHARYYHTGDNLPLQILFHGYRSSAARDFSGGLPLALEMECNALLVDQRAHGDSEGRCLTFGLKESLDCLSWIDYAIDRFGNDTEIVLTGISMGASTVLMAAGKKLPANVKGVIADCGYTSAKEIISSVIDTMGLPVRAAYPLVRLGAKIFGGFDLEAVSAPRALESASVPVLFIHGKEDNFVPCDMSRENYSACKSEKYILAVDGAGHGLSFVVDTELYRKTVMDFLIKIGVKKDRQ